jgi:hypothetical protein
MNDPTADIDRRYAQGRAAQDYLAARAALEDITQRVIVEGRRLQQGRSRGMYPADTDPEDALELARAFEDAKAGYGFAQKRYKEALEL